MNYSRLPRVNLGDERLNSRYNRLIKQFLIKPASSIPQACLTWKDTKAAYRFFSNDEVSTEQLFVAQYQQTVQNIKRIEGIILAPQDTTDLIYTTHQKTKGLGSMGGFERLLGIHVHSCLAVTENGIPLGLMFQYRWVRDPKSFGKRNKKDRYYLPIEQKESIRWLKTLKAVEQSIPKEKTVVVIGDRESDIYPLFAHPRQTNVHLLVRAAHNRGVVSEERLLFQTMDAIPACGTITIHLAKTPTRKPRNATLTVKYTPITLKSPDWGRGRGKGRVNLFCVQVIEMHPSKGESPVSWTLLTTFPVYTFEDAKRIIMWYTKRWLIERFHYVLKSGCKIEELQLQTRERLERALALYCVVSWQLLWITYEARKHPMDPCTKILAKEEWQALIGVTQPKKKQDMTTPPTIQEAVRMLASLGGFLGRKSDKDPGVKTLWIGLRRFHDMAFVWRLLKRIDEDMGKG